jgi:16S rRNA (cytosine967-C5)-methyltransferase
MIARLHAIPWRALDGLGPTLAPALDAILSGAPAADVLDRLLRANPTFTAAQRQVTSESLFGVGLWRRRLRAHVGDLSPLALLACLARDLGDFADAPRLLGVDVPPARPLTDWRDRTSVPDWLADALVHAVGPDAEALADALNLPGPATLRVNRARCTRDELRARLAAEHRAAEPGRFSPDALHVTTRPANLTATGAWRDGLFEVQDEGSQLLAQLVVARPGESVLDLCAGAGGKTLALAARLPDVTLHATDVDHERLERLRTRAARAGATVRIHHALPDDLRVHHVLIDAPCSELGALRRGPDLRWRLDPASFSRWPPLQRALLDTAARHLLPGGTVVYATCTLRSDENDDVVAAFLAARPDFHRARPALPAELLDAHGALRTFPHRHGTDGFFGVVLQHASTR